MVAGFVVSATLLWTLQCSLLQSVLSIDIYETIVWGSQMQWGHSKHPPLSGWIGYFFSWVTGHSDWGMYFVAQLCLGLGVWFTYRLARLFFDRYRAAVAALLLYLLIFYTPSETKFSTYFVEIAIAPLAAYTLLRALREGALLRWIAFGALCALGILNKYSFGLMLTAFALIVLTRREYRRALATPGPYLAFLVFLLMISPHLKWLYEHHFVCFRHTVERLEAAHSMLMPLMVAGMVVYPLATELLALALVYIPFRYRIVKPAGDDGRRARLAACCREFFTGFPRSAADREALHFAAILTLFPGTFYLAASLCGTDIILMWLCTVFSASGIMLLALVPVVIDRAFFRRFAILLMIYIAVVFVVMTLDSLFRTAVSMHIDPTDVVCKAEAYWRRHSAEPVPVVVGGFRFAALFSHYSAGHPPVCEVEDEIMLELYRDTIRRHGALLIDNSEDVFDEFFRRIGRKKVKFLHDRTQCRALLGEERRPRFIVGYLAPEDGGR